MTQPTPIKLAQAIPSGWDRRLAATWPSAAADGKQATTNQSRHESSPGQGRRALGASACTRQQSSSAALGAGLKRPDDSRGMRSAVSEGLLPPP